MDYYVYTDGACSNNGRLNAKAGYGIYFGENDPRNVARPIIGKQTNNIAELTAIIEVYPLIESDIKSDKNICIMSDSIYAIRCVGEYGEKCSKNNWTTGRKNKPTIPNVLLVKKAFELYECCRDNVYFKHVLAHTGRQDVHSIGNDWADRLANLAIGVVEKKVVNLKIYLTVSYAEKDAAKKLGAKWDPKKKKWYCLEDNINKEVLMLF